jgi:hypothetical protein
MTSRTICDMGETLRPGGTAGVAEVLLSKECSTAVASRLELEELAEEAEPAATTEREKLRAISASVSVRPVAREVLVLLWRGGAAGLRCGASMPGAPLTLKYKSDRDSLSTPAADTAGDSLLSLPNTGSSESESLDSARKGWAAAPRTPLALLPRLLPQGRALALPCPASPRDSRCLGAAHRASSPERSEGGEEEEEGEVEE